MKKILPTITVIGNLQELIEIESILVMLGYDCDKEKKWNDNFIQENFESINHATYYGSSNKSYNYYTGNSTVEGFKNFNVKEIEKIIEYVENYNL